MRFWRTGIYLGVVCGLLVMTGCSGDGGGATVNGKVTYKNGPVSGLTIRFDGPEGKSSTATLDADGNYKMTNAPIGKCAVSFVAPPGQMMGGSTKPPKDTPVIEGAGGKVTELPKQFFSKDTANLSVEVKKGANDIPIEVK